MENFPLTLCTQQNVEDRLSEAGVRLRLDDDQDQAVGPTGLRAMDQSLQDAAQTVYYYTFSKYSPLALVGNPWVVLCSSILAAFDLSGRRGNPQPESLIKRAEGYEEKLKEIRDSQGLIPFAGLRRRLAPQWSDVRVDPRYQFRTIRVAPYTSSPPSEGVPELTDWEAAYTFEI